VTGWVLLHRSVWESPDFKPEPFSEREAFVWSLSQAAHSPHVQWFNGVPIPVERGQFATSSRKLAAEFKWSEKRARSFMDRMQKRGNWTLQAPHGSTHLATLVGICNYERFQSRQRPMDAPEDAAKGTARTHPGRTEDAQHKEWKKKGNEGERSEGASPARAPNAHFAEAIAMWSEAAAIKGWSPVTPTLPLSDKRRRGLGTILKTHGLDAWRVAIQRAMDSDVLGCPAPPAWFNFDFMCDPNKFPKVKDGNYDQQFSSNRAGQPGTSPWLAANAQLSGGGELQPAAPSRSTAVARI
jgi:hypothetical protein